MKKAPPLRVPSCEYCKKPCAKGIVRNVDGVWCSPKHHKAAMALRAVAVETTALAIPESPDLPAIAVPTLSDPAQRLFRLWLGGKRPDTRAGYIMSARHFAAFLVHHRFASPGGHPWDVIAAGLSRGGQPVRPLREDEVNDRVGMWITEQLDTPGRKGRRANKGSIATRCSGVRMLCKALKASGLIPFVPEFIGRPQRRVLTPVEQSIRFEGVSENFVTLVRAMDKMVAKPDATPLDIRDWAIAVMASEVGMRRIEIIALTVPDVDFKTKHMMVLGKGRDEKEPMAIHKGLIATIRRWLKVRATLVDDETGPLFISLGRGYGGPIGDRSTLNHMLKRRAEQFGITLTMHDFRRVFCTEALRKYGPVDAIPLTRHASPSTVMLYDLDAGKKMDERMEDVSAAIARRRKSR